MVVHRRVSIKYLIFCARASQLKVLDASRARAVRREASCGLLNASPIAAASALVLSGSQEKPASGRSTWGMRGPSEATIGTPEAISSMSLGGDDSVAPAASLAVLGMQRT